MNKIQIEIPKEKIKEFCKRNQIRKLAFFGSVLRDDFRPDSDVDIVIEFESMAHPSLFDLARMQNELEVLLGRKVDLVEASGLRNPFRRYQILRTQQVVYAA
ncbi:MAG: nucleotidyltransferase family protein [Nitrospirae bacterium]|nr:nucleotidyltransferase family protein [Nitrospirota bacterium]